MAISPGAIGGINTIAYFREHQCVFVNIVGVGAIGGVKFRRYGEKTGTEYPFQTAAGTHLRGRR
jgi:hypothetical protein